MTTNILIVESPAKSKTIEGYLGKTFKVLASYGHIRDLPTKEGAVDTENDFAMKYKIIERNRKHVMEITKAVKAADNLYLATDPDREGEAISWHLLEVLKEKKVLEGKGVFRVVFNEITKKAVKDAIANPREISHTLVQAQQARRALDYLVGFNLSPLLWRKITSGLSAGRVQSPALRLLVEREEEIEAFKAQEYWKIEAKLQQNEQNFAAALVSIDGHKLKQFDVNNAEQANAICDKANQNAQGKLNVVKYEQKQRKRNPPPPLITSTLQQAGVQRLGFTSSRTMRTAQQLYEGIDLGEGQVGLITYMRTDSVVLSEDALTDLRSYIKKEFGEENVPAEARRYKTKSKNAQEAHEAIRPTSAARTPQSVRQYLSDEQFKLYNLVWMRAVASQMVHATLDTVSAELSCGDGHIFKATGSTIRDPGFLLAYPDRKKEGEESKILPPMKEGDSVDLQAITPSQHFTEPPPRYNEATLVKTLEEYGIGRPSTYASIISTLQSREYAKIESKAFHPTSIGRMVNKFLTDHFEQYVDYHFTAGLEDSLDEISRGERDWVPVLNDFWFPFKKLVDDKAESVSRKDVSQVRELGEDTKAKKPVSVRMGRFGPYVQLGTAEDEEKPRFASLKEGQTIEGISLEEALSLLTLPRTLGATEEGEEILVSVGRFGPYVKYGNQYVSLPKDADDDPYTLELDRALELIKEKKEVDAKKLIQEFPEHSIKVLIGRYGPYMTDGNKNVKVPKGTDPAELSLEECLKMIEEAPAKKGRGGRKKAAPKKKAASKKKAVSKKKAAPKKKKS